MFLKITVDSTWSARWVLAIRKMPVQVKWGRGVVFQFIKLPFVIQKCVFKECGNLEIVCSKQGRGWNPFIKMAIRFFKKIEISNLGN